ncbi:MAG: ABC transporter permease [Terriglobales bacterium]
MLSTLAQDLRYATRVLRRHRSLSAVIILTLALAIGANTAIFSLMDALLLAPLPVHDPQHLYLVDWSARTSPYHGVSSYGDCLGRYRNHFASGCSVSWPFYQQLQAHAHSLTSVTASAGANAYNLSGHGQASIARLQSVAGNYFSTVGVGAAAGRLLAPSDDQPGAPIAVVLSYDYWQSEFAGSPAVIGQSVDLNNVPVTIAGVADRSFSGLTPGRVFNGWLPLAALPRLSPDWSPRRFGATDVWLVLFARVRPGVPAGQAAAEVNGVFRNSILAGPSPIGKPADDPKATLDVAQTALRGVRGQYRQPVEVLMWAVGFILLLACANVAGLLLGRAAVRQKELALRRALGASGGRILRQLMTESLLLALIGGALGLALAWVVANALVAVMNAGSYYGSFGMRPALDLRVLAFTFAATVVTGLLFGLAPGLRGARSDLNAALKDAVGNSSATGARRHRFLHLGNALVVAQVALCMVVLVGAGLLVRTLQNLRNVAPGFNTSQLLLFSVEPELIGYKGERVIQLYEQMQRRLAALPGVTGVSYSESPLLSGDLSSTGYKITPGGKDRDADVLPIGLSFFGTMKMPLLLGRGFMPGDFVPEPEPAAAAAAKPGGKQPPGPPRAIIVNAMFVHQYLGAGNPVGRVFGVGDNGSSGGWRIVGVVGNAKYNDLRSAIDPTTYIPSAEGFATFEVRTAGDPMAALSGVRAVLRTIDPALPLFQVSTQTANVDQLLFRERLMAGLASCFGGLALLLAAIGLYGLLAQEVTRRTREIGIRMALGAERGDVLRMVVGLGATLAALGLAIGVAGALGVTRYLTTMLYGLSATDATTLAAVGALLLVIGLAACWIPARRATRVDPLVALRYE